jgi:hypothetical protein
MIPANGWAIPNHPNMQITTEAKLRRIEQTSILLRAACTGLAALVVIIALVAIVVALAGRMTSVNDGSQTFVIAQLGRPARFILGLVAVVTAGVILNALYHLRRLLDNYSRREIFTAGSARQIHRFGLSCILWGMLKVVWAFLPLLLLKNPPRSFAGSADALVIGAIIVGISWFAEMAASLREESDLTI